jgi:hypothetical protein
MFGLKTVKVEERVKDRVSALYLVQRGGITVGQLEKYRDSRSTKHPWKAWLGTGMGRTFLGAFYPDDVPGWPVPTGAQGGGRDAALAAIARADAALAR